MPNDQKPLSHAQRERAILDYWEAHQIFQKSVDSRPADRQYTFYDGPPFATGLPHYGHIVGSVMKDVIPRFWTMRGYRVERVWGWDCHGLPIENIIEKEFDLKNKKDIENYGVGAFNARCESKVLEYAKEWQRVIRRLGRWVDMDNAYKTMDLPFMESIWWVFKTLYNKNRIYEGAKSMHLCPRCETTLSNFEVTLAYADVTDISVTIAVELTSGPYQGAKMLAWTTTPWTLPGNVLLAVGADISYSLVESAGQRYILATSCLERNFAGKEYTILESLAGSSLVGASYDPIFPCFKTHANAFRVVSADFVEDTEGTGVVHIAPGFGADDLALGQAEGVAPIMHVKTSGLLVDEVQSFFKDQGHDVADVPVKAKDKNSEIDIVVIKVLAHRGQLFAKNKLTHSYPLCWRCDTPLINYATSSWFVKVAEEVNTLVKNNEKIHWVPNSMQHGRFGKWLEGARDWAISRSRYWGTPLPVWKSEKGDVLVVGSVEELEAYVGHKVMNLHKHVVDTLVIVKDGVEYRRIPDVLDCWFESGSMPYAQLHYPFENQERFAQKFPAQFIAEGQDQTRGWFYTLHVLSSALFDKPAFENVIVNGMVLAEDGKKMSKKLKNYPDPLEVMEKYGADAVRYYLMSTPVVSAENVRFTESAVDEVAKKCIGIMRNVLSFYELYKEHDDLRLPKGEHVLDAWILARLQETLSEETSALEAYEIDRGARTLQSFVTDLSTWYLRRSRERMKDVGEDRCEAIATLRTVLDTFAKMLAPFMPFLAEEIYQAVRGGYTATSERLSVHLEDWPLLTPPSSHPHVLPSMAEIRRLVSRILEARDHAGIPVKQMLSQVTLTTPSGEISPAYVAVLLDEVNVARAIVEKGELAVDLDCTLTPELIRAGLAREVTRRVNGLRKEANLTIADRIVLHIWSADQEVVTMLAEHGDALRSDTLSESLVFEKVDVVHSLTFRAAECDIWVGF
jgi:isoleucyl-tRNA synthetase